MSYANKVVRLFNVAPHFDNDLGIPVRNILQPIICFTIFCIFHNLLNN